MLTIYPQQSPCYIKSILSFVFDWQGKICFWHVFIQFKNRFERLNCPAESKQKPSEREANFTTRAAERVEGTYQQQLKWTARYRPKCNAARRSLCLWFGFRYRVSGVVFRANRPQNCLKKKHQANNLPLLGMETFPFTSFTIKKETVTLWYASICNITRISVYN